MEKLDYSIFHYRDEILGIKPVPYGADIARVRPTPKIRSFEPEVRTLPALGKRNNLRQKKDPRYGGLSELSRPYAPSALLHLRNGLSHALVMLFVCIM